MYLGLHVKCPIFLFDLNQIWSFSTDVLESPQISRKSVQWAPRYICERAENYWLLRLTTVVCNTGYT